MKYLLLSLFLLIGLSTQAEKYNVILIMADDLGYETIGANGGESYQTPILDNLAANGARFEHCYSQPICTSRVKIMTGKYNVKNYQDFGILPRSEKTFGHYFKDAGYSTLIAGKWQLGKEKDAPTHFGFDESLLWQHTTSGRAKGPNNERVDKRFENPILEKNGEILSYNNGEFAPDLLTDYICDFIERKADQNFSFTTP